MGRTLLWMGIQAAVFAGGLWFESKLANDLGEAFNVVRGSLFGLFGALVVTAIWFDAVPRMVGFFRRMFSGPAPADVEPTPIGGVPAIGSDDCEAGSEGRRLTASARRGGDQPKLVSGRRIS